MSILIYLLVILISFVYIFFKRQFSYWGSRNVPFIKPKIPLGNLPLDDAVLNNYGKLKKVHPYFGAYSIFNPVAIITDLDLIKNILIKDFNYFMNRGIHFNEKKDPLSGHLFNLDGDKWRAVRSKLSPTFTSGKMKIMFSLVQNVGIELKETINNLIEKSNTEDKFIEISIKEILRRFTIDVIGTCSFGIECNSLKDPNAKFYRMGIRLFESTPLDKYIRMMKVQFPALGRFLPHRDKKKDVKDFMINCVRETVEYREKNNVKRNDFLNLLIEIKNNNNDDKEKIKVLKTIEEMTAQSILFFAAGFETSSTTLTFILYELSLNQEIQNRARQEIARVLDKYEGELSYDNMGEMNYIDQIITESLRKYPAGHFIVRRTAKDYVVPSTKNDVIKKDTPVMIPMYAIHHDPDYYKNPDVFNPNRFAADSVQSEESHLPFFGFGDGPRNCIGARFGRMQVKIGLITLLTNFKFSPGVKTRIPMKLNKYGLIISPEGDVWLKVEKL